MESLEAFNLRLIKIQGKAPNRIAILDGFLEREIWHETHEANGTSVEIEDGIFIYGRGVRPDETF